jgi:hypothetical protein
MPTPVAISFQMGKNKLCKLCRLINVLTIIRLYRYIVYMKATIDIPDDLYRQVKAKSALQGQAVREVAVQLFQSWICEAKEPSAAPHEGKIPSWFGAARRYARRISEHDMDSVRRSIARGRARKCAVNLKKRGA